MNAGVQQSASSPAVIDVSTPTNKSLQTSFSAPVPNEQNLRTIELSSGRIREGFGKVQLRFFSRNQNLNSFTCFYLFVNL